MGNVFLVGSQGRLESHHLDCARAPVDPDQSLVELCCLKLDQ